MKRSLQKYIARITLLTLIIIGFAFTFSARAETTVNFDDLGGGVPPADYGTTGDTTTDYYDEFGGGVPPASYETTSIGIPANSGSTGIPANSGSNGIPANSGSGGIPASSGTGLGGTDLNGLIKGLISLINNALYIVAGLAVIVFIWGIVRYLYSADNAEVRAEWRNYMIYGVIALTVITGIWGIVNAVVNLFGIGFVGPQFKAVELPIHRA